ncbi:ComEA family DNA-binding protein [Pseudomonas sp. MLB6B]
MSMSKTGEKAMQGEMAMQGDKVMQGDMVGHSTMKPGMLDLNMADAATLQKELAGIGKAKAEAIVKYRDTHGPFTSVDELLEINGIGSALLERNRDKLMVK